MISCVRDGHKVLNNGVEIGDLTEQQYFDIRYSVLRDWHLYMDNLSRLARDTLIGMAIAPCLVFWLISPDSSMIEVIFNAELTEAIDSVRTLALFLGLLYGVLAGTLSGAYTSIFSKHVAIQIRRILNIPYAENLEVREKFRIDGLRDASNGVVTE